MLPKASRLSKDELAKVLKTGKSLHTNVFSLKYIKSDSKVSKFAFVASKKECGGSVTRNKAKRRARAAIRHINISSPIYCTVFLKKSALTVEFREIVDLLRDSFSKLAIV